VAEPDEIARRFASLETQVRRQRIALVALGLAGAACLLMALAPASSVIDARAIRIVDDLGRPRILIGAPPPSDGRTRKDAQTSSIVFLNENGIDRLIIGQAPAPRIAGRTYPRIANGYGVALHDEHGSERGGMAFLDNGRGVVALDRAEGDAVALIANDKTGFAGLTVNYENRVGQYQEGVRIGTKGDEAWLSLQDRAQRERARLSTSGPASPMPVTHPARAATAR
jgi:hypothetical protein